jgi:hypothetical protein
MTEYEKLSLAMLSNISQGIGLELSFLDMAVAGIAGANVSDIIAVKKKYQPALEEWHREMNHLAGLFKQAEQGGNC